MAIPVSPPPAGPPPGPHDGRVLPGGEESARSAGGGAVGYPGRPYRRPPHPPACGRRPPLRGGGPRGGLEGANGRWPLPLLRALLKPSFTIAADHRRMVVKKRLRAVLIPLALYSVSGLAVGYFLHHAQSGQRGARGQARAPGGEEPHRGDARAGARRARRLGAPHRPRALGPDRPGSARGAGAFHCSDVCTATTSSSSWTMSRKTYGKPCAYRSTENMLIRKRFAESSTYRIAATCGHAALRSRFPTLVGLEE